MTFKIERPVKGKTTDETVENVYNFMCRLSDLLNYHLNNIDEANCTKKFRESVEGDNGK